MKPTHNRLSDVSSGQPLAAASPLAREIHKKGSFDSLEQEAYLNIVRTAAVLQSQFERLFKAHKLSQATYNALRILRGSEPEGKICSHIRDDLVAQVPDVTRLIDRLEELGMAKRERSSDDRRAIVVRITSQGLETLKALDEPVVTLHREQLAHMQSAELEEMSKLLALARKSFGTAD